MVKWIVNINSANSFLPSDHLHPRRIRMVKKLVIIPTYNEAGNIFAIMHKIISYKENYDILVIDDNSPDKTAEIVKKLMREYSPNRIFLIKRAGKLGLGTAYTDGFKFAIQNNYDYIFQMDGDFSHNPDDLNRLCQSCIQDGYDITIGSRYIDGVRIINWSMQRLLISYFSGVYVRLVTRMRIQDPTAGFTCFTRQALQSIGFENLKFIGYAFQIELKFKAWLKGLKIKEIPIVFTERAQGKSKMDNKIILEAALGVISLKLSSWPILNRFRN